MRAFAGVIALALLLSSCAAFEAARYVAQCSGNSRNAGCN